MLHGLKRERTVSDSVENRGGINRIVIRYKDGRVVNVMPDASRKTFSEDDAKELKRILDKGAAAMEWDEMSRRITM